MVEKEKVTIEEVWEYTKRNFKIGKDYIESETEDYIVFCPFNYCVLSFFDAALKIYRCNFFLSHCVAKIFEAFRMWYNDLYSDGMLKAFFYKKDMDLNLCDFERRNGACNPLDEFTGWIDFNDRNFLYFAHDINNHVISGFYDYGSGKKTKEKALSRIVDSKRREEMDFINHKVNEVYDDLFAQYDVHINELEETLFNQLEK